MSFPKPALALAALMTSPSEASRSYQERLATIDSLRNYLALKEFEIMGLIDDLVEYITGIDQDHREGESNSELAQIANVIAKKAANLRDVCVAAAETEAELESI